jgi:16S rRNA (uracil1498-N3)-methyltransferase
MLHFSENNFVDETPISTIVVGCEGGFSQSETALVKADNIVGFRTALVLKSESAVCALASKILL